MPILVLSLLLNRYVAGGLVVLGLLVGAYVKGYSAASAKCHDAQLRAEIAAMQRDMLAWKLASDIDASLRAELASRNLTLQQKVTDYEAELAKHPDARCSLSADDVKRLRGIGTD